MIDFEDFIDLGLIDLQRRLQPNNKQKVANNPFQANIKFPYFETKF